MNKSYDKSKLYIFLKEGNVNDEGTQLVSFRGCCNDNLSLCEGKFYILKSTNSIRILIDAYSIPLPIKASQRKNKIQISNKTDVWNIETSIPHKEYDQSDDILRGLVIDIDDIKTTHQ